MYNLFNKHRKVFFFIMHTRWYNLSDFIHNLSAFVYKYAAYSISVNYIMKACILSTFAELVICFGWLRTSSHIFTKELNNSIKKSRCRRHDLWPTRIYLSCCYITVENNRYKIVPLLVMSIKRITTFFHKKSFDYIYLIILTSITMPDDNSIL